MKATCHKLTFTQYQSKKAANARILLSNAIKLKQPEIKIVKPRIVMSHSNWVN